MLCSTYSASPLSLGQCSHSLLKTQSLIPAQFRFFVMEDTPVINKCITTCLLKVVIANGHKVMSTHMCDIKIDGLPVTLTGHIIPELSIALLFGIRVLTEAGCTVKSDKYSVKVRYNNHVIWKGDKDKTTDLWTLPLGSSMTNHHSPTVILSVAPVCANAHAHLMTQIAFLRTPCTPKPTASDSHTSLCVAQEYQPY